MLRKKLLLGFAAVLTLLVGLGLFAYFRVPPYHRSHDVVYGRKAGMALTMEVFTPENGSNGLAVIAVASSGFVSGPEMVQPLCYHEFLRRGYTVFAVMHGSQPLFTVPEIIEDIQRAVRFVRYNARSFGIDPRRIGILGASSGGHLSLMQGSAGDDGDPQAADPIDRVSSRVQAVGCFYAPTDLLNFGAEGKALATHELGTPFTAVVDYKEFDREKGHYVRITDERKRREITAKISPITHVNSASAPTLFFHGDEDELVPLQQSERMVASLKKAGVPAELIIWKGVKHGDVFAAYKELPKVADWFDTHLVNNEGTK
jgi:acetyl esterase/lipase